MNNRAPESNNSNIARLLIISTAVVLLILGGFYIWVNRQQNAEVVSAPIALDKPPAPVVETPALPEATEPAAAEQTPAMVSKPTRPIVPAPTTVDGSDNQVKLAIADLAPAMAAWLMADQQLRKWVLAIDLMADGDVPKSYRPLSFPIARFEPDVRGAEPDQQYFMKPVSFTRADVLLTAFTALDPALFAQYYQAWLPILEKAYQEQGKKDKFDQRFRMALQNVINAKPLTAVPELKKRGGVIYVYADEKLEAASDVEKMLWRLGPDNSAKLQSYLKQLVQQLPK